MVDIPAGSIVRLDKWQVGEVITEGPIWVRVVENGDADDRNPFEFQILIGALDGEDHQPNFESGDTQWVDTDDVWTLMPEREVPDEVWVAAAKLALLA